MMTTTTTITEEVVEEHEGEEPEGEEPLHLAREVEGVELLPQELEELLLVEVLPLEDEEEVPLLLLEVDPSWIRTKTRRISAMVSRVDLRSLSFCL